DAGSLWHSFTALFVSRRATGGTTAAAALQRQAELEEQVKALHRVQAVIEFHLDGTIVHANDNFLQTLGYTLEEIQGRHHAMFVDAEYAKSREYQDFWANLGRGEFNAGQYR
ncbi:PAS domain S-box protein, partial [Mycobacterium tuberculosis]